MEREDAEDRRDAGEQGHAHLLAEALLPFRVKRHSSRLLKQLGESEMWLQHNKVRNLAIAIPRMTDILLRPGETFSFCRLVGRPTREKGYVEGMELSRGKVRPGVGGACASWPI